MTPTDADLTSALSDYIAKVLDTNDLLAEFMETAAERLEQGDNVYRVAHYLKGNAKTIRGSRDRIQEDLRALLRDEPEPVNALREYLSKPDREVACMHVGHGAVDCIASGLPRSQWCLPCKAKTHAG